jgi:membrane protease YdiL (CAAX protease family)
MDDADPPKPDSLFPAMLMFESSLGLGAWLVSWLVDYDPWIGMRWTRETLGDQLAAIGYGVAAAVPVLGAVGAMYRWPIGPLRGLRTLSRQYLAPLFTQLSLPEQAAVALAAGIGEELLFRGLVQAGLASAIGGTEGMVIALVVASLMFGVCHWLSNTYAVLATLMGFYFGGLLLLTGNLWTPMIAHATYDLVALVCLTWSLREENAGTAR